MQAGTKVPAATGPSARSDLRPGSVETSGDRGYWRSKEAAQADVSTSPLVYFRSKIGRRASYFRTLKKLFAARRGRLWDLLFSRAPALFLEIDDAFLLYVMVTLVRAVTGRRTAGLLLKPLPLVISSRWHHRCKRFVLQRLRLLKASRTLTIVPFSVFPPFSAIASGWVYDFELWDLAIEERKAVEALRAERSPNGRLVLAAIGTQSLHKGFRLFADTYTRCPDLRARYQFISCGRIEPVLDDYAAAFLQAGGVSVNRTVSNAELLGSYAASDAVWCLYPPAGDHASGVLGRAAQLGIPVVVRYGSLAHRLCIVENIQHMPATVDGVADRLAGPVPPRDEKRGHAMALRFARQSEAALRDALGLEAHAGE
jgi:hypothetical protein